MSLKICVYAICKNEEKFVRRWMESMSEADGVYVLDTGSDDGSVLALGELGAIVHSKKIQPWRFDTARNLSLELVPADADICVCTDLDEVFDPGWRDKLEKMWCADTVKLSYRYVWSQLPDGREGTVFMGEKIHSRHGWRWIHPVHEVLERTTDHSFRHVRAPQICLRHFPDQEKSRSQYLPLLELAVKERPGDDRNMHYLGREYMYCRRWRECIETLNRHLALPSATWRDERCASMRYIARSYAALGLTDDAMLWHFRAITEAPHLREPWLDAAELAQKEGNHALCLYFAAEALKIQERSMSYIDEPGSWGEKPYDLAAIACFYLGRYGEALEYGEKALEYAPGDPRLLSNMVFYKSKAK